MKIEEKDANLDVKAFDNQHQRKTEDIHPNLPYPPFSMMMIGSLGTGKSTLITRLIYGNRKPKGAKNNHHKFYRHFFDKIYVFSPSWGLDPKCARCQIPDDQIFSEAELYDDVISEIVSQQRESIEENGKDDTEHVLMIFSDCAGKKNVFSNAKGVMMTLAFNLRHYKISTIIDTQSLRQINNAFRENMMGVFIFGGITNRLELKKIYDEYLGSLKKEEADKLLEYVFHDNKFNFLYLNLKNAIATRYHKNFNQLKLTDVASF